MESQPHSPGDNINQHGKFGVGTNQGELNQFNSNNYGGITNNIGTQINNNYSQTQEKPKQPPNNFPGNLADNFIGREKDLAKLDNIIKSANQVAISAVAGMGGVGKSELAKQYISRHQKTYPGGICWLNATEDNFISQLIGFSGVEVNEKLTLVNQVQQCYNNWQWQGNVLLVFDDLQNYRQIKSYLPNQPRFKVLITTRKRLGKPVVRLDLDVLSPAAALELLASFLDEDRIAAERETAEELCAWLGYLPLGLELVGRYLAKKPISLAKMLERLKKKSLEHKSIKDAPEESNAERGVKAAFELSWEALQENSLAQGTAYFLSLFALAPIPQELLEITFSEEDWEDVEDALVELADLHLVKFLQEETYLELTTISIFNTIFRVGEISPTPPVEYVRKSCYLLHSLIREFLRTKELLFDASQLKQLLCKVIVAKGKEIPQHITADQVTKLSPFIPHLQEAATKLSDYLTDEDLIEPFGRLGRFYEGRGLYNLAEPWLLQGKAIALTHLGEKHPNLAVILNNLAELYRFQGRYEDAEPLYQQAMEILRIALPPNHPQLAINLNNRAELYRDQGRYEEAEPLYQQAIEIVQIALPPNHPQLATHLNNLAIVYSSQGRYEEAEPLYQQAIEIDKIALSDNHPSLARDLNNLANLYRNQGRYEEAEPLYLQAIEIDKINLPPNHPQLAIHLNNLAELYRNQGRYEEAEPLYLQGLRIDFNSLGENHPNTQRTQRNFVFFVEQVIRESREKELSNHPVTQNWISEIKNN